MNNEINNINIINDTNNDIELKTRKIKIDMRIIIISIVVILLVGIVLYFIFNKKSDNKILLYSTSDKELKYIASNKDNSISLANSFNEDIKVKFNDDKTKFIFIKDRGLYIVDVNKESNDKIGNDVRKYYFINDKDILYLDFNKNLYIASSLNDKDKIDIDVEDILFNKNNIIIYNKKEEIYLYNVKSKDKNRILNDFNLTKDLYVSANLDKIMYISKDNKLKIYDINSKKTEEKTNNVNSIVDYSKDFSSITYTTLGEKKKYYDLYVNDNPADNVIVKYQCTYLDAFDSEKFSDETNNVYYLYEDLLSNNSYIYYDSKGPYQYPAHRPLL